MYDIYLKTHKKRYYFPKDEKEVERLACLGFKFSEIKQKGKLKSHRLIDDYEPLKKLGLIQNLVNIMEEYGDLVLNKENGKIYLTIYNL